MSTMLEFKNKIRLVNFSEISTSTQVVQVEQHLLPQGTSDFSHHCTGDPEKAGCSGFGLQCSVLQSMFYHVEQCAQALIQTDVQNYHGLVQGD